MDKKLSEIGFWLGLVCMVLALVFRFLTAIARIPPFLGAPGENALSYLSFFHGAELFFLLTITISCKFPTSRNRS